MDFDTEHVPRNPHAGGVDDLSGSTLGARFRLLKQLGRGGMGAVYLAEDLAGPATADGGWPRVAVKVIKDNLVDDPAAIKRFEREAVTIGRLHHPHIVAYRGTGVADGGVHWLAMEFLDGQSLRDRIAQGPIPWRLSLDIIAAVVDALSAAHVAGVLHRDLKPDNVMLVGDPRQPTVKLLDFGIAKQTGAEGMTMTNTGMIVGTPGFIAPEVIVGGSTDDPRSDLYAVGVMWFEMVTGARPFDASTPFALAMKHVQEPAPRPNSVRPFSPLPGPVEDAIMRLLEKQPEKRFKTALSLGGTLTHLIEIADNPPEPSASTLRTRPNLAGGDATETGFMSPFPPSTVDLPARPPPPPPPARRGALIGAAVVVVVLGVVAAVIALREPTEAATTVTAPVPPPPPPEAPPAPPPAPEPPPAPAPEVPEPPPAPVPEPPPAPTPPPVKKPPVKKPQKPHLLPINLGG